MRSRMVRIGALVAIVAFGGACGDDDDSADGDAASEVETEVGSEDAAGTKEQYIAQADAICADYLAKADEVQGEAEATAMGSEEPDPIAVQEFFGKLLDLSDELLAELRDLTLPAGDVGTDIDAALGTFERGIEEGREQNSTPEKAMAYMTAELQRAFGGGGDGTPGLGEAADEQAAALGFQTCFSGGDE